MKKAMNFLTPFSYAKLHTLLVILGTTAATVIDVGIRKQTPPKRFRFIYKRYPPPPISGWRSFPPPWAEALESA